MVTGDARDEMMRLRVVCNLTYELKGALLIAKCFREKWGDKATIQGPNRVYSDKSTVRR